MVHFRLLSVLISVLPTENISLQPAHAKTAKGGKENLISNLDPNKIKFEERAEKGIHDCLISTALGSLGSTDTRNVCLQCAFGAKQREKLSTSQRKLNVKIGQKRFLIVLYLLLLILLTTGYKNCFHVQYL